MNTNILPMESATPHSRRRALLAAGLVLALPLSVVAATSSWIGTASSANYTNTTYWAGGVVPGASDTALFSNVLSSSINILWTIPVENSVVSFDYRNSASYNAINLTNVDWAVTSRFAIEPSLVARTNLVRFRNGTLSVTNATRTAVFEVGSGIGIAAFDIVGGTLNVDRLVMTNAGTGFGTLGGGALNGGVLNVHAGSSLVLTNSGANLQLYNDVNLLGGTNVIRFGGSRTIQFFSGAVMRVSGSGTVLDSTYAQVGAAVTAKDDALWIQDGGKAILTALSVGSNANAFSAAQGVTGRGVVIVTNGGVLQVNRISTGNGGLGTISMVGGTLLFTSNSPLVDVPTTGTFTLASGTLGFVGVTNAVVNGQITNITYSGANTLRLDSSTNAVLSAYAFSNGAAFSTLDLAGNTSLWRSTNLFVGTGGQIIGTGRVQANVVSNSGVIAPGHSPGTLTFSSNLTLLGGSQIILEIGSGGTNAGAYDRLIIEGTLSKAGTVLVTNLGYTFVGGETFDFIDATNLAGSFSLLPLPTLTGGMTWNTTRFEGEGILSVVAVPEPSVFMAALAGLVLLGFARGSKA